jgi:LysR family hydrogen peroxide-inducible transcriptional activator
VTGSEFAVARLFREPLLAVAANDHPIAQLDRVPPERLAGERILTLETGHRLHDQVRRISEETGAEISLDYGATSLDTIRQMVAMNLGISLLPALYVRSEVQPNQLVTSRPLEGPQPFRAVGMVWRNGPRAGPNTANWRRRFGRSSGTLRRRSPSSTERFRAFSG